MSLDRSLKTSGGLARHRNVLTRAERIEKLAESKKFDMDASDPLGLPKVGNRKVVTGGKSSKKKTEGEGEGEGDVAAAS
jgi:small basic protein (TIGR04137 family)